MYREGRIRRVAERWYSVLSACRPLNVLPYSFLSRHAMRSLLSTITLLCVLLAMPLDAAAQTNEKAAQTGMKFLAASTNPRAAAVGNAVTTFELGSASMFYNPAGMASLNSFGHFGAGNMQWIADINYNQASLAFQPSEGKYGVFGVSATFVDYGNFEGTIRSDNTESGYLDTGTFSPSAMAIGIGYAYQLTDRVSIGGGAKYVRQQLGDSQMTVGGATQSNALSTPAFDFGVIYDTGFRGVTFAFSARNFSPEVTYERESFELPLTLSVGLSADVLNLVNSMAPYSENHSFLLTVDGQTPRDFSEQIRVGGEYTFMDIFSLRAGYAVPRGDYEEGLSLGGGLNVSIGELQLGADYAYTSYDIFNGVNRVAIDIGF